MFLGGTSPMFSVIAVPNAADGLILALTGRVSEDNLPEIGRCIDNGSTAGRVVLDLSEVTLMDRGAARFFAAQLRRGVELVDCPSYLEHWILREIEDEQESK